MDADRVVEQTLGDGESRAPSPELDTFTKGWEQCRLQPYLDSAGRWTAGWGHLLDESDDHTVPLTQAEADALFDYQIRDTAQRVSALINVDVTQQQFDACVDFSYNEGVGAFARSTLRQRINASDFANAANHFAEWALVRNPQTGLMVLNDGLLKRRAAERAIFLFGDYSGRP